MDYFTLGLLLPLTYMIEYLALISVVLDSCVTSYVNKHNAELQRADPDTKVTG